VVLIVLASLGYLVVAPEVHRTREFHARMACAWNLAAVGKAMLLYSKDHEDLLPVAGGRGTKWAAGLRNWTAANCAEAFGLDPNGAGGEATISSSLYLLIRYAYTDLGPRTFLCTRDKGVKEFKPAAYGLRAQGLTDVWDFGPDPARRCSYAYQMVYCPYSANLRTSGALAPGFAIAADRNPWMEEKRVRDFSRFNPAGPGDYSTEQAHAGNALAHKGDGQNVMFLDTHVTFAKESYYGLENDNIYTSWDGSDKVRGKPPTLGSQPADEKDSLLVNDPSALRK
jgi:hypothetical protein